MVKVYIYILLSRLVNLGIGIGPLLTWLYDKFQAVTSVPRSPGVLAPFRQGIERPQQISI